VVREGGEFGGRETHCLLLLGKKGRLLINSGREGTYVLGQQGGGLEEKKGVFFSVTERMRSTTKREEAVRKNKQKKGRE